MTNTKWAGPNKSLDREYNVCNSLLATAVSES